MRRTALPVLATAALIGLPLLVAAPAQANPNLCGKDIATDVTLTSDVDCTLVVTGDGVKVDLEGHTAWRGIFIDGDDVMVKNGRITHVGDAVYIMGDRAVLKNVTVFDSQGFTVEAGYQTHVLDSTFIGNQVAIDQYLASDLLVENSAFRDNQVGVSVQAGDGAVIKNSRFERNVVGVNVWDEDGYGADGTRVLKNWFLDNGVGVRVSGMVNANDTYIEGNEIRRSHASGILVTARGDSWAEGPGGSAGTVIRNNTVKDGGRTPIDADGCYFDDITPLCSAVADDGITVVAPKELAATMTIEGNKTVNNSGHGIDAVGVTNVRNNIVRGNRAEALTR